MTNSFEPGAVSQGMLRSARRLLTRKQREATGQFLVEGRQAVREALAAAVVRRVFVIDDSHADLGFGGQETYRVSPDQMRQLSDTVTPQGVVALCQAERPTLEDIDQPKLVVICAQVRDPGNAGTVIRCADAFGADAVILTSGSVELHNPKTIRASVGSIFHLPIITDLTPGDAVAWARSKGLQVFAADGGGGDLLTDVEAKLALATAWLMGNEAWGLPQEHAALADRVVGVPMWGRAESLNLSTAAAICLYASASAQRQA